MCDTPVPETQPTSNSELAGMYFLKELEFQVAIETKARDRMENMVQYLLTTIAAIIGAVLLVNEMQENSILLLFIACLLVFAVSTSAYYRSCRLRYIMTYARVTRNNIRCELKKLGVNDAHRLIDWEGNPSGFCKLTVIKLTLLMLVCSILGGTAAGFGLMLMFGLKELPANITITEKVLLIVIPLTITILFVIGLEAMLLYLRKRSGQFITDPKWRRLPDYDL